MSNSLALKNLPAPVRSLIRPMLFAAIGLHALLLFTPMPSEPKPKKPDDKENPVKITQLPTAQLASRPKLAKPALPKLDQPKPAVNASPVPKPPVKSTASNAGKPTDTATKDPFADFPHYPGAVPFQGIENLRVAKGATLALVVAHFKDKLRGKFTLSNAPEPNTFKVSKGGVSYFLSVVEDGSQTFYLLGADKLDKAKLASIQKGNFVAPPPELGGIAKELDTTYTTASSSSADSSNVSDASAFFQPNKQYPSIEDTVDGIVEMRVIDGQIPDEVYKSLLQTALKRFDSTTDAGSYGGGSLYELKKGKFTGYLSLVPGKPSGTIAVIWTKKPN